MKQLTDAIRVSSRKVFVIIYRKGVERMQKVLFAGVTGYLALTGTSFKKQNNYQYDFIFNPGFVR